MRRSPLLGGVAVATAALGILAAGAGSNPGVTPAARASARPCLPARGLLVAATIRRNVGKGSEVTEPLSGGGYRITRCDSKARPTLSMTVLPLRDTGGARRLVPALIVRPDRIIAPVYGDPVRDRGYRVVLHRALRKLLEGVLPATPGTPRRDPSYSTPRVAVAQAAAGSACEDKTHATSPGTWPDRHYDWRWSAKSFGQSSKTLTAMKKAHEAWDMTLTDCSGYKDDTKFTTTYKGTTTRHAGVLDGTNAVDKADLSKSACGGAAIACTWVWQSGDDYTEADTRFATDVKWSNSGADGAYDYRGIAAHEFGHSIGLADLDDSGKLTMHFQGALGYTGQRTLGRGDILGLRALYGA
jgi:hypothetical protein